MHICMCNVTRSYFDKMASLQRTCNLYFVVRQFEEKLSTLYRIYRKIANATGK